MRGAGSLLLLVLVTGCSGLRAHYAPLVTPESDVFSAFCLGSPGPTMTDAKVLCFVSTVAQQMRARETFTRNGRELSDAAQVILSASAAALTAMAPGSGQALQAAVALGMGSTVMPQVGNALGVTEKAEAYSAGLQCLLDAEGTFMLDVAKAGGVVDDSKLTVPGAQLTATALGCAQLTDKRITQQLVTFDDLQRATMPPAVH